jgi:hypothetical protein
MSDSQIQKTAYDIYLFGGIDQRGNIKEVYSKDAITNAFKLWITSKKGDILRQPSKGGYLYPWLTKPMSQENADKIKTVILLGLENDFQPYLIVNSLEVIPDYNKKAWKIVLEAYSPQYKSQVEISERIKSLYY